MSTKSKRHTHKYHRVEVGSSKVWACALSDCPHYMPEHMEQMVYGKYTICWQCEEKMILNESHKKIDKPICANCLGINNYLISKNAVEPVNEEINASDVSIDLVDKIAQRILDTPINKSSAAALNKGIIDNNMDDNRKVNSNTINESIEDEFPTNGIVEMTDEERDKFLKELVNQK